MIPEPTEIIDISPTIHNGLAVFPGDTSFNSQVQLDFSSGDPLRLSNFSATLHLGAHCDGPNHYHKDGRGIDQRDLNFYIGLCSVIAVNDLHSDHELIEPSHIDWSMITSRRVLFKTNSITHPDTWTNDFRAISPETIEELALRGVITVGIDTPSIDPATSKKLPSHQMVWKHNLAIIEGLWLENVVPGNYFLSALPLKIKDGDAGPARVALLKF